LDAFVHSAITNSTSTLHYLTRRLLKNKSPFDQNLSVL